MAKILNWQIGREMDYPYEEAHSEKQIAFVFDTNKCIACQTCSVACKTVWTSGRGQEYMWWNNVESRPYGSYPMAWDIRLMNQLDGQNWKDGIYQGKTIFEAAPEGERAIGWTPESEDWASPNRGEDECSAPINDGDYIRIPHQPWMFYLARICNHCTYPSCLASCPRKSIYKRREDGIVLIDQDRCHGYQECVKNCPFKKPMYRPTTGMSEKCVGCFPRVEKGLVSRCVENCIGKIRLQGYISPSPEKANPDNPIDYLVHIAKVALPLYPQFGLGANVYYIPPIHVPPSFSTQMFGPGVEEAIKTYRNAKDIQDLIGLLMLFGASDRIFERFRTTKTEAIGLSERREEIVRVPISEPVAIRPFHDAKRGVYRQSIT